MQSFFNIAVIVTYLSHVSGSKRNQGNKAQPVKKKMFSACVVVGGGAGIFWKKGRFTQTRNRTPFVVRSGRCGLSSTWEEARKGHRRYVNANKKTSVSVCLRFAGLGAWAGADGGARPCPRPRRIEKKSSSSSSLCCFIFSGVFCRRLFLCLTLFHKNKGGEGGGMIRAWPRGRQRRRRSWRERQRSWPARAPSSRRPWPQPPSCACRRAWRARP